MEILQGKSVDTQSEPLVETVPDFITNGKKVISVAAAVFLLAVLFVFPIYYRNYYFDILPAKYQFYYTSVLALAAIVLLTGVAGCRKTGQQVNEK